ncbi:ABC transporter ATP-binding protein [Methanosarcina sp. Mfa9]|uniref:ABC transporter ATP-binding protein n=1 Tax=Methanosarcina sp. Mfa9 TaxID=3439063 RepID=UPI003F8411F7
MLEVQNLGFDYGTREILRGIDFGVLPGEVMVVLGPNGVGKSTLLRCINSILKPKKGLVMVQGENLHTLCRDEIAKRLGYVAQRSETGRLTAFDAILLGRKPRIGWSVKARDREVVEETVNALGLEDLALRYIDQLSGGELQKVAIARALVQEPELILLDEPTSNLDLKNQVDILDTIRGIAKAQGISVVLTMHDINMALRYADSFLIIRDGEIYARGGPEIITPDVIETVYGLPVMVESFNGFRLVIPIS